jgi:DNA-binding transcriptional LysR family regulator
VNLTLKQLEAFVRVADLGSFRKAAERLNTTQPNISSRISSLETALQVTLMERDAGSVRLTSRGHELLTHARSVLSATEKLADASGNSGLYSGVLKLGVTEIVAHTWLRDFLRELKNRFPDVMVELTVDLSANLKKELFSRSIDLTFQSGPFNREMSGNRDLGSYPLVWAAAPTLPVHHHKEITIDDLAAHPILTPARDTVPYRQISDHFSGCSARLVPSSHLAVSLHMTVDAMGIGALPAAMISDELASGELIQVPYHWTPDDLHFLARYDAQHTPGYVAAAAELAAEIAANG